MEEKRARPKERKRERERESERSIFGSAMRQF